MSYLDQAHDPRRRGRAIVAVATIHAVLAYGVVTGLGPVLVEKLAPTPFIGEQIRLPPPPPPPDPSPQPPRPTDWKIDVPLPPIPPLTPQDPGRDIFDGTIADPGPPIDYGPPTPPLPPTPPRPNFAPKRATPSNNSSGWITTDDYPRGPLVDGIEGSVGYRLAIGANGRVSGCQLTRPSGNPALDDATCRLITRRARFEPATDETGARVAGAYTGTVTWQIPD